MENAQIIKFQVFMRVIFVELWQYWAEKVLWNISSCFQTASLGGGGLKRLMFSEAKEGTDVAYKINKVQRIGVWIFVFVEERKVFDSAAQWPCKGHVKSFQLMLLCRLAWLYPAILVGGFGCAGKVAYHKGQKSMSTFELWKGNCNWYMLFEESD